MLCVVVDVFPAVGASLREKRGSEKQIQTHGHSVNTNILDHIDCLSPFVAALQSARLCGCQTIVIERGIKAHAKS